MLFRSGKEPHGADAEVALIRWKRRIRTGHRHQTSGRGPVGGRTRRTSSRDLFSSSQCLNCFERQLVGPAYPQKHRFQIVEAVRTFTQHVQAEIDFGEGGNDHDRKELNEGLKTTRVDGKSRPCVCDVWKRKSRHPGPACRQRRRLTRLIAGSDWIALRF